MSTRYPTGRVHDGPATPWWTRDLQDSIAEINGRLSTENLSEVLPLAKMAAAAMHNYAQNGSSTPASYTLNSSGTDWTIIGAATISTPGGMLVVYGNACYEYTSGGSQSKILIRGGIMVDGRIVAEEDGCFATVEQHGFRFKTAVPIPAGTHVVQLVIGANRNVTLSVENYNIIALSEHR